MSRLEPKIRFHTNQPNQSVAAYRIALAQVNIYTPIRTKIMQTIVTEEKCPDDVFDEAQKAITRSSDTFTCSPLLYYTCSPLLCCTLLSYAILTHDHYCS